LFTEEERPLQFEAAKESLDFRVSHNGGRTGWSRAWIACLYARLGQGEEMYENICKIISEFTTKSLLDVIPLPLEDQPFIFQIDASLGAVAAITEGIAQYKNDKLYLLPAIPKHWKNGEIKGLHLPGGHCVSFKWQENIPTEITVRMGYKESLTIIFADKERVIAGKEGEVISITKEKK
jgi:alpha-L-fucosidase 2